MKYGTGFNTENKKIWPFMVVVITSFIFVGTIGLFYYEKRPNPLTNTEVQQQQIKFTRLSKAAIQKQVLFLANEIASSEQNLGYTGIQGYKLYSAKETAKLLEMDQALGLRLHYLEQGNCNFNLRQWNGYFFNKIKSQPYDITQVNPLLSELAKKIPGSLLKQLKIFILPYPIKDIAGLGGSGYDLISAYPASETLSQANDDLKVTLIHEIGHHIHLSFMPENTIRGKELWNQYLKICGGKWHGPGAVNTKAWSNSSEETFAEYFRMLFGGKNQPFFGDITLGDPRINPHKADRLIQFVKNLAGEQSIIRYSSPWLPDTGLYFWESQNWLILILWLFLGTVITALNILKHRYNKMPWRPTYFYTGMS
jgi:hypothetical protein